MQKILPLLYTYNGYTSLPLNKTKTVKSNMSVQYLKENDCVLIMFVKTLENFKKTEIAIQTKVEVFDVRSASLFINYLNNDSNPIAK